jgi:hypothetical protein
MSHETKECSTPWPAAACPEADIAVVIGIALKTLRKHFRDELDTGHIKASAKVAGNLYQIAIGSGREAVTAAIFWLKVRAGWREPVGVREYPVAKSGTAPADRPATVGTPSKESC